MHRRRFLLGALVAPVAAASSVAGAGAPASGGAIRISGAYRVGERAGESFLLAANPDVLEALKREVPKIVFSALSEVRRRGALS